MDKQNQMNTKQTPRKKLNAKSKSHTTAILHDLLAKPVDKNKNGLMERLDFCQPKTISSLASDSVPSDGDDNAALEAVFQIRDVRISEDTLNDREEQNQNTDEPILPIGEVTRSPSPDDAASALFQSSPNMI